MVLAPIHKIFDTPPSRQWSLTLFHLNVAWTLCDSFLMKSKNKTKQNKKLWLFRVDKLIRYHLKQVTKVGITNSKSHCSEGYQRIPPNSSHCSGGISKVMQWEVYNTIISLLSFWKMHNLYLIMRKASDNTNWGIFYKTTCPILFKR